MVRKPLIIIMGACAAGKSTLGRHLLGPEAEEYNRTFTVQAQNRAGQLQPAAPEKVKFCINTKTGWAVAGNLQGGSDCINSRAALTKLTEFLLLSPKTKAVIVNSVRFSQQADIIAVSFWTCRPLYICFQLSEEENLKRLLQRRKSVPLPPQMQVNFARFRHRNNLNLAKLKEVYSPRLELITATDGASCKQIQTQLGRVLRNA